MNTAHPLQDFLASLQDALEKNTFIKISLVHYTGPDESLKTIFAKKILIKRQEKLSFTYRHKTRDIVKNYDIKESLQLIVTALQSDFHAATLYTTEFDLVFETDRAQKQRLRKSPPTQTAPLTLDHDRQKNRPVAAERSYLHDLGITDATGTVIKAAQDKYRQINKFIEIISGLIKDVPSERLTRVIDMGSGKGYLTFALYDYLTDKLGLKVSVTGVEVRDDMVGLCNKIARTHNFSDLKFVKGTIEECDASGVNVLIALHACDTATDDAVAKGIKADADLIVVAPCCHKQIRREMESTKAHNDLGFLTRYGTFTERQAEMVTDGMRALILNHFGYSTKVFEFISDAHTPKNVMIVAQKTGKKNAGALKELQEAKAYFGISEHHLEKEMGLL